MPAAPAAGGQKAPIRIGENENGPGPHANGRAREKGNLGYDDPYTQSAQRSTSSPYCRHLQGTRRLHSRRHGRPRADRGDRAIIARFALHFDVETGTLCIDYATVAEETLVSERTAMRTIAKAAALGWIKIERRQGKTNNFRLLLKAEGVTNSCHP